MKLKAEMGGVVLDLAPRGATRGAATAKTPWTEPRRNRPVDDDVLYEESLYQNSSYDTSTCILIGDDNLSTSSVSQYVYLYD